MKILSRFSISFLAIGALLLGGCEKDKNTVPVSSSDSIYFFVNELMNSWYYWYDEVPEVDYLSYNDPTTLLDDLKVPLDRWSYMDDAETIMSLFEEGEYFGFGFYLRFDTENRLRIPLIYQNSTAYSLGIRKGDEILTINNIPVTSYNDYDAFFDDSPLTLNLEIRNTNGEINTFSLSKETVVQNAVFFSDVFNVSGRKAGYMVYDSFLGYSLSELEETFSFFAATEIDELIVDLRYNRGGYVSIVEEMANIIAPAGTAGSELYSVVHNDLAGPIYDTTIYFSEHDLNLDLQRVFFITSGSSASASEMIINCLEPYMDVYLIGSTTHGKPVGMYGFEFQDWIILPVVNITVNADGYGGYFDGLTVDKLSPEGLDKPWGDLSDPSLNQALYYISNGSWDVTKDYSLKTTEEKNMLNWGKKNFLLLDR